MIGAVEAGAGEAGRAHAACRHALPRAASLANRVGRPGLADPLDRPPDAVGGRFAFGAEQPHGQREMGEDMVDRAGLAPVGLGGRASVGQREHAAEQAALAGRRTSSTSPSCSSQ